MQNSDPPAAVKPVQRYNQFFIAGLLVFFGLMGLGTLQGGLSDFEDHLLAREHWVSAYTWLRLNIGDRVFAQVVVGREGWLDYIETIPDYQNLNTLSLNDFAAIQMRLSAYSSQVASLGADLVLVVVPDRSSIYPEYVANQIPRVAGPSQLDQFIGFMHEHSSVRIVDLRPALIQAKANHELYYKTGTHWSVYGAYIGYQTLLEALPSSAKIYPFDKFTIAPLPLVTSDLAHLIGVDSIEETRLSAVLPQTITRKVVVTTDPAQLQLTFTWNPKSSLPNLVMFHDSFGEALIPFMAQSFRDSTYLREGTGTHLDLEWIIAYHPRVVIIEVVERNMAHLLTFLPPLAP